MDDSKLKTPTKVVLGGSALSIVLWCYATFYPSKIAEARHEEYREELKNKISREEYQANMKRLDDMITTQTQMNGKLDRLIEKRKQ